MPPETISAGFARRQEGSVKRAQLLAAGLGPSVVKRQARNGALHRIHRGVYIVGHLALPSMAIESAALLACGEGALISHRSAAYLWSMVEEQREVDVTLVGRRCRPRQGVRIQGVSQIDRRDVRRKGKLVLTAPARTLIDLASNVQEQDLERAVAEARVLGLVREGELERALERAGQRTGVGRMRAFLRHQVGPSLTRSDGERRLRRLIRVARLPMPMVNTRVAGFEVDFLWPDQRVIVEVQGYRYHRHRGAFERDHRKAMALENAGYHVIRTVWRQLVEIRSPSWRKSLARLSGRRDARTL